VLVRLHDVFHGDQAAQLEGVVDDQHALEAVLVHQALGFVRVRFLVDVHEFFARGHLGARFGVEVFLETQVAVGDDADHLLAFDDREAAEAMLVLEGDDVADLHARRHDDRVAQHACFETLDARHFAGLVGRTKVLVDNADAAFLRHRDCQTGFGHGVHRGREQRDVERDVAGQLGAKGGVGRKNIRVGRDEQHIIERECFLK
jgi:hypothetical protein